MARLMMQRKWAGLMLTCGLVLWANLAVAVEPIDVWLDVDTANGVGDVDDGLMMIQALHDPQLHVRGVSVQFGNADLERAVPIAQHILDRYGPDGMVAHPGAATAEDFGKKTDAVEAMAAALREKPMHILAVGPVTNAGTLVQEYPELHDRILSIIMVAARRPGQRFVVEEDQKVPFRDANFEKDVPAMQAILDTQIPLVFAPWEISTFVWLRPDDMQALRQSGGAGAWIEATSRYWLIGWKMRLGVDGFTPFDTLAVAWLTHPQLIKSMPVTAAIEMGPDDGARPVPPLEAGDDKPYLVVRPAEDAERSIIYTYEALPAYKDELVKQLSGREGEAGVPNAPLWGTGSATFDHSTFDAVLKQFVTKQGLVDYAGLAKDPTQLDAYIANLAEVKLDELTRDERLALLLNAYNAFTLRLILDHYPVASIKDIPEDQRWKAVRWNLGGEMKSLDMIEHLMVRPVFDEPRIHWALVCAAVSCPPLRGEAYTAGQLDAQLADQTKYINTHEPWLAYEAGSPTIKLTPLYKWYGQDFVSPGESVLPWIAPYNAAVASALEAGNPPEIHWADYDWSLNQAK